MDSYMLDIHAKSVLIVEQVYMNSNKLKDDRIEMIETNHRISWNKMTNNTLDEKNIDTLNSADECTWKAKDMALHVLVRRAYVDVMDVWRFFEK